MHHGIVHRRVRRHVSRLSTAMQPTSSLLIKTLLIMFRICNLRIDQSADFLFWYYFFLSIGLCRVSFPCAVYALSAFRSAFSLRPSSGFVNVELKIRPGTPCPRTSSGSGMFGSNQAFLRSLRSNRSSSSSTSCL